MAARRAVLAATVVLCAGLTTACDGGDGPDERNVPDSSASGVAPPSQEPLAAPEVDPGFKEILSEGPQRGVREFGTIELPKGESWVKVNCISVSKSVQLNLSLETIGEFSVGCSGVDVERNANQLNLASARKLHFTVSTEESVRWYVSVQVPKE
jgi:hypothetical protein